MFVLVFFSFLLVCFFREEQKILAMKMNSLWFTKLVSEDLYFYEISGRAYALRCKAFNDRQEYTRVNGVLIIYKWYMFVNKKI